jgi:hypothetical protein
LFKKTIILGIGLALMLVLCSAAGVAADSSDSDQIDLSGMTLSEIVKMFPMSAEEEAAIVHTVPQVPVVIDGKLYKPEEISLFDGQRLHFTVGSDGVLYAFTIAEGLEKFIEEESDQQALQGSTIGIESTGYGYGHFYWDWWYGGSSLNVGEGIQIGNLGYWNDKISSVRIDPEVYVAYMFEHIDFGGNSFTCRSGSLYPVLWLYGWNDRASSLAVIP